MLTTSGRRRRLRLAWRRNRCYVGRKAVRERMGGWAGGGGVEGRTDGWMEGTR